MPIFPRPDTEGESTGAGLIEKQKNIDQYNRATEPPVIKPPVRMPAPKVDRIKPNAKFGDRPGEARIDVKDMLKPLPSYKEGTRSVAKTGPAIVHKGEAIIPAKDNPMAENPYELINKGAKKPPKKLKAIHTRKAKTGGFIHEHHYTEPTHHAMEEHTTPDMRGMLQHMQDHMGEEAPAAAPTGAQAQEQALGM